MTESNQNVLGSADIDDSGGVDLLGNTEDASTDSNIMTTDTNLEGSMVEETLQGFTNTTEEVTQTTEFTDSFDDQLIADNAISDEPITGVEMTSTATLLNFSDYETGSLDSSDQTDEDRYIDQYRLTGFEDNQTVTLDLNTSGFSSVLQLINANTGDLINSLESLQSDGTSQGQMVFTSDSNLEYFVRVTSTGDLTTGTYTLGTTLGDLNTELIITDREMGVLEVGDDTHQGRYKDEYVLRGFEDNQNVILNLETLGFGGSLQLFDRNTGDMIKGTSESQLSFTTDQNREYLVRVTSTGETTTGSYTLETTLGELILGVSDQVIKGTLTDTDEEVDLWSGRYSDTYEVTQTSAHQTLNIELTSFEYNTIVFLINADTGGRLASNIAFSANEDGSYTSHISWSVDANVNYGVIVSSYQANRTGDYTLSIDTTSSVSGSFESNDDSNHPIIRTRLMDNYLLSNLQVGEDVSLKLSSDSSNIMQLFNQETGDVLQTTRDPNINFSVEENITYGVRVLGQEGEDYNLLTDTGILFDSTAVQWGQPLTASLVTGDMVNMFAHNTNSRRYYGDGYYISANEVVVGDSVEIQVESIEFPPTIYLLNAETGELIDDWLGSRNQKTVNFNVEEEIGYLILVSSLYANQVGEYTFSVDIH